MYLFFLFRIIGDVYLLTIYALLITNHNFSIFIYLIFITIFDFLLLVYLLRFVNLYLLSLCLLND